LRRKGRGSAPDPAGGAYSTPPDLPARLTALLLKGREGRGGKAEGMGGKDSGRGGARRGEEGRGGDEKWYLSQDGPQHPQETT